MADMIIMHAVEALIIMPATRESSEDLREGLEAFGAKRKPRFRGNDGLERRFAVSEGCRR